MIYIFDKDEINVEEKYFPWEVAKKGTIDNLKLYHTEKRFHVDILMYGV
ncbi:hypothetical protein RBU61_07830 [Tissierella sp. MB52-C2]|nr:hypothetical protein [Tissierella sp. MB52-C2]WMM26573.1 hypothetical protein RBU61_07830 [Tissierella sp. MB52-C2]